MIIVKRLVDVFELALENPIVELIFCQPHQQLDLCFQMLRSNLDLFIG